MDPVILFLDEPTSVLDPEMKIEVLNTLRDIAKRDIAILIVTHEIDFAKDTADRIVIIEDGVIVEEGEDVLTNPKTERVKKFLGNLGIYSSSKY